MWPFTRHLPHVDVVRHAISIDEKRRPYASYAVAALTPEPGSPTQDLRQVWFSGVHSDVGGMFPTGTRLSDIPLKWIAQEAVVAGMTVETPAYQGLQDQVRDVDATGAIHKMGAVWALAGIKARRIPPGALVHASVYERMQVDRGYAGKFPADRTFVDPHWRTSQVTAGDPSPATVTGP